MKTSPSGPRSAWDSRTNSPGRMYALACWFRCVDCGCGFDRGASEQPTIKTASITRGAKNRGTSSTSVDLTKRSIVLAPPKGRRHGMTLNRSWFYAAKVRF
jgi:hypothetical protein